MEPCHIYIMGSIFKSFFKCLCLLVYLVLFSCQQFFAWFANVEAQMEEEQESSYRYYTV